jgi:hypothetical protein
MGRHILILLACLAVAVIPAPPAFAGEEVRAIEDDEEYRVYAAVLFPNKPEIPDAIKDDPLRRDLYLSERPRLDGLGLGNRSAVVYEQTKVNQKMRPADDGSLTALGEGFNRKTEKPARISKEQLLANLPKDGGVRIITDEEMSELFRKKDGWDRFRQKYPFAGGIKGFSRVGFDPARTQAVVFVGHQADYRMGVGYWIYLEKSASSGKWIISGSRLAYIS